MVLESQPSAPTGQDVDPAEDERFQPSPRQAEAKVDRRAGLARPKDDVFDRLVMNTPPDPDAIWDG